ncbi:MAG: response regulator [Pseudomonadota bacterium]
MSAAKILVVDDELNVLRAIDRLLTRAGYSVVTFDNPTLALSAANAAEYDVVISDYQMPDVNGVDFLATLQSLYPDTPRIMLTGQADKAAMVQSINKAAVFRFLQKPYDNAELIETVSAAVAAHRDNEQISVAMDKLQTEESADYRRKKATEALERESPGITDVNWTDNGTIIIDDF